jgi:hypothetical protein
MHHGRVDLGPWKAQFPLDVDNAPRPWEVRNVVGPRQLALYQQIHEVTTRTPHLPEPVPADVCVWNLGDAPRRDMTKVGGLPYLPRSLGWPTFAGEPLVFLGQFCFADSADLVGPLPAEILLLFSQAPGDYPGYHEFLWVPLGSNNLIRAEELPATKISFRPCYASLFRTQDYDTFRPLAPDTTEEDRYVSDRPCYPLFFDGSKIGGASTVVPGDYPEGMERPGPPGRFLAQLDSIGPLDPWPFLNLRREASELDSKQRFLKLIGHGTLFLYLDENGAVKHDLYFS